MKTLGIIPARYASTRFPGKPLVEIAGKTMIQRVYEQSLRSNVFDKVVVATDNGLIYRHVAEHFEGNVMMTLESHRSGTDRCAEVLDNLEGDGEHYDVVINIQGDEPLLDPRQIVQVYECFKYTDAVIATLVHKILKQEDVFNPNCVKVVVDKNNKALYFSRNPIPYVRDAKQEEWIKMVDFYKHIGIYGFRSQTLKAITKLPQSVLEVSESLEQLRWLENGFPIQTALTDVENIAIDTPDDLNKIDMSSII